MKAPSRATFSPKGERATVHSITHSPKGEVAAYDSRFRPSDGILDASFQQIAIVRPFALAAFSSPLMAIDR
jgi:hypothetical protein